MVKLNKLEYKILISIMISSEDERKAPISKFKATVSGVSKSNTALYAMKLITRDLTTKVLNITPKGIKAVEDYRESSEAE